MPTLLVVDDEPDILQALAAYLEVAVPGLQVVAAPSAEEALAEVGRSPPDLILSDYKMPGMTGIDFLVEVGRRHPRIPALLMTAYADAGLAMRAANEARVRQFLTKPVDPQRLVAIVREVLGMEAGGAVPGRQ